MATKPSFPSVPVEAGFVINNATGTNTVDVYDSVGVDSKIGVFTAFNGDTVDRTLTIYRNVGGTYFKRGEVVLTAGVLTDILEKVFNNVGFSIKTGNKLAVAVNTAVTAGKQIDIFVEGGTY